MLYKDIEEKLLSLVKENDPYNVSRKFHIKNWIRLYWVFLETGGKKGLSFISNILADKSCWEEKETLRKINLNRYKVAEKLLELSIDDEKNPFDSFDRYRIACWCCLENNIFLLFNELRKEIDVSGSVDKLINRLDHGDLMIFWSHSINGLQEHLTQGRCHSYIYGFKCAIAEKQIEALEYFWGKIQSIGLSSEQKEELLFQVALYKSVNGVANANMVDFCLNHLNPSRYKELLKQDLFKNGYYSVLHILKTENFFESEAVLVNFLEPNRMAKEKYLRSTSADIGHEESNEDPLNHYTKIHAGTIKKVVNVLIPSLIDLPTFYSKAYSNLFNEIRTGSRTSRLSHPIFVVGCPRSGTTLTGSCLAAHPQLMGSEESLFLLCLWQIFSDLHQGNNNRRWAPLSNYISANDILTYIGNFADNVFSSLCPDTKNYVDHTPWYVLLIPFIKNLYPDCRFVHVIRNGIDVVNSLKVSYLNGFKWCGKDLKTRSKLWSDLVTIGKEFGSALRASEYIELHYEDLVAEPETEIKKLLKKLNLEWNEKCLQPLAVEHAGPSRKNVTLALFDKNSFTLNKSNTHKNFNIEGWTTEDKEIFLSMAKDTMNNSDYSDQVARLFFDSASVKKGKSHFNI